MASIPYEGRGFRRPPRNFGNRECEDPSSAQPDLIVPLANAESFYWVITDHVMHKSQRLPRHRCHDRSSQVN